MTPGHLLGQFNSFSVILRVNEARDLGDVNRFSFYDHTKIYTAAPPDVLRVNEKNLREYYVFNVLGFLITTNHKTMEFSCRPTIAGTTSRGPSGQRKNSRLSIGNSSGLGIETVASDTWRRI